MKTIWLVHHSGVARARAAVDQLGAMLAQAGHQLRRPGWSADGRRGELAAFEDEIDRASVLILVDPQTWWTLERPWTRALRRRIEHDSDAALERVIVVEGATASPRPPPPALERVRRLVIPREWPVVVEAIDAMSAEPPPWQASPLVGALGNHELEFTVELDALDAALAKAMKVGQGTIWIRGGPGTGKSVLLGQWVRRRREAGEHTVSHRVLLGLEWTVDVSAFMQRLSHAASETEGPMVAAIDGRGHTLLANPALAGEAMHPGLILVVASRALPPGLEPKPRPDVDLDRSPGPAKIAAKLLERAEFGEQGEVLEAAVAGNPGAARALLDGLGQGVEPSVAEDGSVSFFVPPALEDEFERSWSRMAIRAGDRLASLRASLAVVLAANGPLSISLTRAVLGVVAYSELVELAAEWLVLDDDQLRLASPLVARFLAPELDASDPRPNLRLLDGLASLRWREDLDEASEAFAIRHERVLRHRVAGLDLGLAWLSDIAELERLAGSRMLERRLSEAAAAREDSPTPGLDLLLGGVRRWGERVVEDPASLATWMWTEAISRGHPRSFVADKLQWPQPAIALRHPSSRVDHAERCFVGPGKQVQDCAIDHEGRRVVAVDNRGRMMVWALDTGACLRTIELGGWTQACALSGDGCLAFASPGEALVCWSVDNNSEVGRHEAHDETITTMAASADGLVVVSGDDCGTVIVWRRAEGKHHKLGKHGERIMDCDITPDGRFAITGGGDNVVMVWDLEAATRLHRFTGHSYRVCGVGIDPTGTFAASVCIGETRTWDLEHGRELAYYDDIGMSSEGAVLLAGRRELLVAGSSERIHGFDLETGQAAYGHLAHSGDVEAVAATPDGEVYASAGDDGCVRVWRRETMASHEPNYIFDCYALAPGDAPNTVWVCGRGEGMQRHDLVSGEFEFSLVGISQRAVAVWGKRVVTVGSDYAVQVFTRGKPEAEASWKPTSDWLRAVVTSPEGDEIACGGDDSRVYVSGWAGENQRELKDLDGWIYAMAWPTDDCLIAASGQSQIGIWNPIDGSKTRILDDNRLYGARTLVVGLRDKQIYVSGTGSAIIVLGLDSGEFLEPFEGHAGTTTGLVLAEDERLLVSVGEDACMRLWSVDDRQILARVGLPFAATCVTVVGRRIVVGDSVGNVLVYDVDWDTIRA